MKRIKVNFLWYLKVKLLILLVSFYSSNSYSQDKTSIKIEQLYNDLSYQKIIDKYAYKANEIGSLGIYLIGKSYFLLNDDQNAIKFFNLAIAKDSLCLEAYYMRGVALTYRGNYKQAILSIEKAIQKGLDGTDVYSALGDAYLNSGDAESALDAYLIAKESPNAADRPFVMIPQIYATLGDSTAAILNFYIAKERINKKTSSYNNILYNLGVFEHLKGNYDQGERALKELIMLEPDDYAAFVKLIQVLYAQKKYGEAQDYKKVLYAAKKQNRLQGSLENMFCFDQFKWNEFSIQAFERYEEEKETPYYKHLFYVSNLEGEIQFRLQTENIVAAEKVGRPAFAIGKNLDDAHFTYAIINKDDLTGDVLKSLIIRILNGEITPVSSSK